MWKNIWGTNVHSQWKGIKGDLVVCSLYTQHTVQFRWRKWRSFRMQIWSFSEVLLFFFLPSHSCDSSAALLKHLHQCNCEMRGCPSCSNSRSHLIGAFLKSTHYLGRWDVGAVVKFWWAAALCTQHQVSQKNTAFVDNHFLCQNCWFPSLLPSIYCRCKGDMLTVGVSWYLTFHHFTEKSVQFICVNHYYICNKIRNLLFSQKFWEDEVLCFVLFFMLKCTFLSVNDFIAIYFI